MKKMKILYLEENEIPIQLDSEGMINLISDTIKDAVKYSKEISFRILILPENQ